MAINILLSYLTRKRSGDVAHRDQDVRDEIIRLGRGADCQVYLADPRVPLLHSEIHDRGGGFYIEAAGPGLDLKLNGVATRSARLNTGDKIDLGPYELVVGSAEGKDMALSVELTRPLGDDFAALSARSRTTIHGGGLGKRGWSWLLFIVAAVVALGLPLLGAMDRAEKRMASGLAEAPAAAPEAPATWVSQVAWLSGADSFWISGDISRPHRHFAEDCGLCHEQPFVQVRDGACLACHGDIEHHADPKVFQTASFAEVRCAHCHKEHEGADPIVLDTQAFCVSCHGDLDRREPMTTLHNAGDFGTDHPEFRPSVVSDPHPERPVVTRMAIGGDPKPAETSNLKFPHDKHLPKGGVKHPTKGTVELACGDCHAAEPGGVGLLPISMEAHCHECHRLQFDPTAPERLLQHGKPREAVEQMREFYAMAALHGGVADPKAPQSLRRRRLPGAPVTPEESAVSLNWALQKAAEVASETIGKRACGTCHNVTAPKAGSEGFWGVAKPRLADRWLPKGIFDHGKHDQMACVDCHDAPMSKSATDVLLPGIDSCRRCHGGEAAAAKVPSTCIACHGFHRHDLPPMRDGPDTAQDPAAHRLARSGS